MKRLSLCFAALLCLAALSAQTDDNTMSDIDRIALTPVVLDDAIPAGAHKQLINKMTQIAAKSGCAATENSRFVITCSADVLTSDITPTAPPMHAYTIALHFYVGDGVDGRLFSSTTIESKGVGPSPEKAYLNALKNVRVNDPAFKMMVDKGKEEIIAYYNTRCDLIIAEARSLAAQRAFVEALDLLAGVPQVCEACYRKALDESVTVYQSWRNDECASALNKAQAAWAKRDVEAAAQALGDIPADGACVEEAQALRQAIAAKLDAEERKKWDFRMQQYDDHIRLQEEAAAQRRTEYPAVSPQEMARTYTIPQALREERAANKRKAARPAYQVKGKWFK